MSKNARKSRRKKETSKTGARQSQSQRVLPLVDVLVGAQDALHELVVDVGLQVVQVLLEEDREHLCGPWSQFQTDRTAYRHGYDQGQLVLGGRKISVAKPRVRSVEGEEVSLPSWEQLSSEDPLQARMLEQVVLGVSTRKYQRSLEALPETQTSIAVKKSSVSRRFVAQSQENVKRFLNRSLSELDLPVIMFDGKHLGDHLVIIALGIDTGGRKHVLGVREGSTESYELCRSFLQDLLDRGLRVESSRLFVIDGSRGLRKAILRVFGGWALIQRCQIHKMRNVLEHLPEKRRAWARAILRKAFHRTETAQEARTQLKQLARSLREEFPGAASSVEEGLDDILTLLELGISGNLYRVLRSTNPIENLNGRIQATARNVKRWRGGAMAVRWAVTGIMEASKKFRRIQGYKQMPTLLAALSAHAEEKGLQQQRMIA